MAQVDLDLAKVLALLKQMGGVGVTQGMDVRVLLHTAGFEAEAEGALQRGAAHRLEGGGGALAAVTFGGEEQRGMTMSLPLLAQELKRAHGQRHVTILIAFAAADVQEHAFGVDVADLKPETLAQTEAAGVDGDQSDAMIQERNAGKDLAHFGGREDDRQFELRIGADQFHFVGPDALEGFLPEDFDAADGLGGSLAGNFFNRLEMDAILADLLGGDQLGRFTVEFAELADAGVIGVFGARTDGQEFKIIGEGFQDGVRRTFFICIGLLSDC